jgi:ADP-ribose pyrophosphatase YjhB (NUDIX family)
MAEFGRQTSARPPGRLAAWRWWIDQRLADLQNITVVGNLGITVLAVAAAGIILFRSYDIISALAMNVPLVLLVVWDYRALFRPSRMQQSGTESMGFRNPKPCVELLLEQEGRYIAVRRLQYPQTGKLDFVGGFAEPQDASIEAAARRELNEETELDLDPDRFLYIGSFNDHYGVMEVPTMIFCYLVLLKANETPVIRHEEFGQFERLTIDEVRGGDWAFSHQIKAFERMIQIREQAACSLDRAGQSEGA